MRVQTWLIVIVLAVYAVMVGLWSMPDSRPLNSTDGQAVLSRDIDNRAHSTCSRPRYSTANRESERQPANDHGPAQPANTPERSKPSPDEVARKPEPERQLPSIVDSPPTPNLDPLLTDADYEAIASDSSRPASERDEARKRKWARYASWAGRDSQSMGGFLFKPSDYRELDGWKVPTESYSQEKTAASRIENVDGGYQGGYFERAFCMRRTVGFQNSKHKFASVSIEIVVASSVYWAQQELVANSSGKYGGESPQVAIGDNSFVDSRQGRISFTRNNVFIEILFGSVKDRLDEHAALSLARSIDGQIVAQAYVARDWADLANVRPQIQRFDFATYRISTKNSYPKLVYAEFSDPRPPAKDHFVRHSAITEKSEAAFGWSLDKNGGPGSGGVGFPYPTQNTTTRVWLYVYNESLLFSVAERTVEVIAEGAPENK